MVNYIKIPIFDFGCDVGDGFGYRLTSLPYATAVRVVKYGPTTEETIVLPLSIFRIISEKLEVDDAAPKPQG